MKHKKPKYPDELTTFFERKLDVCPNRPVSVSEVILLVLKSTSTKENLTLHKSVFSSFLRNSKWHTLTSTSESNLGIRRIAISVFHQCWSLEWLKHRDAVDGGRPLFASGGKQGSMFWPLEEPQKHLMILYKNCTSLHHIC